AGRDGLRRGRAGRNRPRGPLRPRSDRDPPGRSHRGAPPQGGGGRAGPPENPRRRQAVSEAELSRADDLALETCATEAQRRDARMAAPPAGTRPLRVALAGVPNCGKTALLNALTGARQKVANYAGVTVERKEGAAVTPLGRKLAILDLPGTYSLRARSPDEAITRDAVLGRLAGEAEPDVVVCVADATSLRVALRLALELKAAGRPMVLALNMIDIATRQGLEIDIEGLSRDLGM